MVRPNSTTVTNQGVGIDRRAWSIPEVCETLGVSRNFLLGQIRRGLLRARRLGRRVVVLTKDLDDYLETAQQVGRESELSITSSLGGKRPDSSQPGV
jgi:excisionase family DNA binding protein